jgi:hypothetical protein
MDRVVNTGAVTGGILPWVVTHIGTLNEFLKAGVSVVSIVMMVAATLYYLRKPPK